MSSQRILTNKLVRRSSLLLIAMLAIAVVGFKSFHQTAHANGENGTRLLRTPTVSATQIAFAYAQNIWTVPRAGGMARRITSFQGQTSNPHFSPDGKLIAFSGEYAGNLDVYVVSADGGEPKRLGRGTSPAVSPRAGTVAFISDGEIWSAPLAGGATATQLIHIRGGAGSLRWSPDGAQLAFVSDAHEPGDEK